MPIERPRSPRRSLFAAAVLALACATAGCETAQPATRVMGSFRITGDGMYEAVQRWREHATPGDRAVIDELIARKDLQIHIFLIVGRLSEGESRGGASDVASGRRMKELCDWHPKPSGVPPNRDWDVVYDRERAEDFEKRYGISSPPEVYIHHEFFGHVVVVLRDPKLEKLLKADAKLFMANEREALDIENQYRKHIGVLEVPPKLMGLSAP